MMFNILSELSNKWVTHQFRNAFLVGKNFLFEEAHLIGAPTPPSGLMKRPLPVLNKPRELVFSRLIYTLTKKEETLNCGNRQYVRLFSQGIETRGIANNAGIANRIGRIC